jgi:hypothetical protein
MLDEVGPEDGLPREAEVPEQARVVAADEERVEPKWLP